MDTEKPISRRKLLTALGAAGLTYATAGGLLEGTARASGTVSPSSSVYNVKDYGAADGNRYHQNGAEAIQKAIYAATTNGGGTVYLPAGNYYINTIVMINSNIRLVGDGQNLTKIIAGKTYLTMFRAIDNSENISISDIGFEGLLSVGAVYDQIERALQASKSSRLSITNCSFKQFANALLLENCNEASISDCTFTKMYTYEQAEEGIALLCKGGFGTQIRSNRFEDTQQSGVHLINDSNGFTVSDNMFYECKGAAIRLIGKEKSCSGNTICSNRIQSIREGDAIRLEGLCSRNLVADNFIEKGPASGITLSGSGSPGVGKPTGNRLEGNFVSDVKTGIYAVHTDTNTFSQNDIRTVEIGIAIDADGKAAYSYSENNRLLHNSIHSCKKQAVLIASKSCRKQYVAHIEGSGNKSEVTDQGENTILL
ncbi:right-handed parallel beta-helix repeat-containing protein [Paenibacillus turpanensis]|uniref:right-handed parallel beta-helix repeat-containing protein n=1 Tax=Paenibacillus turpanensis TaxID=2689078 RepID=UPI0014094D62|nr:right-handed parallel beta-helix repeat-containing protein [Paenibacillus turpanensis]